MVEVQPRHRGGTTKGNEVARDRAVRSGRDGHCRRTTHCSERVCAQLLRILDARHRHRAPTGGRTCRYACDRESVGVGIEHRDDVARIQLSGRDTVDRCGPRVVNDVACLATMRRVRDRDRAGGDCRSERVGERGRRSEGPQGGDVVERAAVLDVVLEVGANTDVLVACERRPREERPANTQIRTR